MAADVKKIDLVDIDLDTGRLPQSLYNRNVGLLDADANGFGVRVFRSGVPEDLTGVSVYGYYRTSEGVNRVINTGNVVSGNEAYVVLPGQFYNYKGQFTLAIKLVRGSAISTVRIIKGIIDETHSNESLSPSPDPVVWENVLNVYEQVAPLATAGGVATVAETKSHLGIS